MPITTIIFTWNGEHYRSKDGCVLTEVNTIADQEGHDAAFLTPYNANHRIYLSGGPRDGELIT